MVFRLGIFGVLFVALIAVLIFAFSILHQSKPQAQEAVAPTTEQILVAATPLTGGALLQPTDITAVPMATPSVPTGAEQDTPANRSNLVGSMVRVSMAPGTPILASSVIYPGDHGFLASVLAPGMRAVTIAVDDVTGANGLIWPGDNVDVLLTQTIEGAPISKSIAAEVVLSDVRVIATGAELIKGASNAQGQAAGVQTVTLEVTPDQASRCLVAINLGKLSLIVHSAQTNAANQVATAPLVWSGDVSPALADQHPPQPTISTVHVFQGTPDSQDYNF